MGTDRETSGGRNAIQGVVRLVAALLVVTAVVKELRTPREQRTWHGTVAGFVPYDFRRPTVARARERLWAPQGRLVTPHVFGVGWTLNLGRALALLRSRAGRGRDQV